VSESRPSEDGPKCLDGYSHQCRKSPEKARANTRGKGKPGGDQERHLWDSPDTATGQELFLSGGGELSARWVKKKKGRR